VPTRVSHDLISQASDFFHVCGNSMQATRTTPYGVLLDAFAIVGTLDEVKGGPISTYDPAICCVRDAFSEPNQKIVDPSFAIAGGSTSG